MDYAITQYQTVFISAGHSDRDPGAAANGVTEADIVLEFRDLLCDELKGKLLVARDGDRGENMPLSTAVEMAKRFDIAVEFHCDAASPSASGTWTLSRPEHYPLGRDLCDAVSDALGIPSRGAKPEDSGQHSRLAFVSGGGGIILELFFLTNPGDLESYRLRKHALVKALASVLINHACKE